ncbi:unnamed protein product [Fraxinus pennsylvanica]|uniref:Uncharacterized protein n=1 Tax=Fraxinus pennsylvanica TaxID=56036 RepID=A0AAD1YYT1_9LAMI|nr:unnamed protein product [Fraxinus pennsylvanica]
MVCFCFLVDQTRKVRRCKPAAGICSRCGGGASVADMKTATRFCCVPFYVKSWRAIMCTFCGAILSYTEELTSSIAQEKLPADPDPPVKVVLRIRPFNGPGSGDGMVRKRMKPDAKSVVPLHFKRKSIDMKEIWKSYCDSVLQPSPLRVFHLILSVWWPILGLFPTPRRLEPKSLSSGNLQ